MPKTKRSVLIAYIPVIHEGYLRFFRKHKSVNTLYIVDQSIISDIDYLRKDIRALKPRQVQKILATSGLFEDVQLLTKSSLKTLDTSVTTLIMPDDDVSEYIKAAIKHAGVKLYPVFLRWDRRNTTKQDVVSADKKISRDTFHEKIMNLAGQKSLKSTNIWRRVGAVIVKGKTVLMASSNRQLPTDYTIWIDGDPRSTLKRGEGLEVTTDMHAEALLIANAAKRGISLKGASIYVTTFPCPPCSKLVAESGITTCYYSSGYATLDGEELLRAYGVELVYVEHPEHEGHPDTWVPYPEKKKFKDLV